MRFSRHAAAVLCPYDWPEPFGIVLTEALACGTPVLAYRRGSIPEIIEGGVTGFICDNLEEMVTAIDRLPLIQRATRAMPGLVRGSFYGGAHGAQLCCPFRADGCRCATDRLPERSSLPEESQSNAIDRTYHSPRWHRLKPHMRTCRHD